MRFHSFFFIFVLLSTNIYAEKIATFKLSYIIDNIEEYIKFQDQLNNYKDKIFNKLKKEEEDLILKKNKIEDSKLFLTDLEFEKKTQEFNILSDQFKLKIDKYNNILKINIENNEKIITDEIANIVKEISINKNIDLVFADNQYFISSMDIDISDLIIQYLNKKELNLEIITNN